MLIVVELMTPPELAPIVVVPIPLAVANPAMLGAFAIVATLEEDELQCVVSVTSCTVLSLNVPVATNCCVLPSATDGVSGEIAIDTKVPLLTDRKSTRLNSSHVSISYAVFCLKKKKRTGLP